MYGYIARRLAFGAVTVVGVSIMVFVVMRILPGDPLVAIFGPEGFTKLTEKERAHYMAELGLTPAARARVAVPEAGSTAPLTVVKVIQHFDGRLRDDRGAIVDPDEPNTLILDGRL